MDITKEIDMYIKRISKDYNLSITLHPLNDEFLILNSTLIKYNFHTSPYCTYVKTNGDMWKMCKQKQKKILEKLKTVNCFTGVCHAGIKERIYGFYMHNHCIGFVAVGGYKTDVGTYMPRIANISHKFGFAKSELISEYDRLQDSFPDEKLTDSLIFPLCRMIEYGNLCLETGKSDNGLYSKILRYINENYYNNISVGEISKKFYVSVSGISHTFKKNNGMGIKEYVNFLRVETAKNLLKYSEKSIVEIGESVGFYDSSHFCKWFKKFTDMSPEKYRKSKAGSI